MGFGIGKSPAASTVLNVMANVAERIYDRNPPKEDVEMPKGGYNVCHFYKDEDVYPLQKGDPTNCEPRYDVKKREYAKEEIAQGDFVPPAY